MRYILPLFFLVLVSCSEKPQSLEQVKSSFGPFGKETIKVRPLDYTKTPIYNAVEHHPEDYEYLNKVDIFSIAHMSDGLFLTGLMVKPKKPGNYPVIVFNRGGNRDLGSLIVATAVNIMAPIASEGYVVVATNYRGNSRGEGKEEFGGNDVNDITNLINSMPEVDMADTSRIGLLGLSRGGMMNYLILKDNHADNIKAVINIGGITDLATTIKYHPQIEEVANDLIPNFNKNRALEIKKRSAIHWASELSKTAPILILHGMKDEHVDYSQIPAFTDSLEKHDIPFKSISFKDGNHGIIEYKEDVFVLINDWFGRYVKDSLEFDEPKNREIVK